MSGKNIVFIIIGFSILVTIVIWFMMEYVIDAYDVDRALSTSQQTVQQIEDTSHLRHM
ncbi:MAG TPA: hypothetical protein VK044_02320 [Virgibacillus sp.]|nr:hypothetical protein [Virgibacillus sp.]